MAIFIRINMPFSPFYTKKSASGPDALTDLMPNAMVYASKLLSGKGSCCASPSTQVIPRLYPTVSIHFHAYFFGFAKLRKLG